jgi:hypothetical protein
VRERPRTSRSQQSTSTAASADLAGTQGAVEARAPPVFYCSLLRRGVPAYRDAPFGASAFALISPPGE